jgi:hypothetical protein
VISYTDESFYRGSPGCYVLAAVLVPDEQADPWRDGLCELFTSGTRRRRFHFRAETPGDRLRMLEYIRECGPRVIVVSAGMVSNKKQDRARGLCLTRLTWELQQMGVGQLVIETRGGMDQKDRQILVAAQKSGCADRRLRYSFGQPSSEPLLWLPDAIAGPAVRASHEGMRHCHDQVNHLISWVQEDKT